MLILARGGSFYARLQITGGINAAVEIPVMVDWPSLPQWMDIQGNALPELIRQWQADLQTLVSQPPVSAYLQLPEADLEDSLYPDHDWWQEEALLAQQEEEVGLEHDLY